MIFAAVLGFAGVAALSGGATPFAESSSKFCELRTPAGDVLSWEFIVVSKEGQTLLFFAARPGTPWPTAGKTFFATLVQKTGTEYEFVHASKTRRTVIRMDASYADTVSVWSMRDGKPLQPVMFGHCGETPPERYEEASLDDSMVFDSARWTEDCYLMGSGPTSLKSRFAINETDAGGRHQLIFKPVDELAFREETVVPRQIVSDLPQPKSGDVFFGVSRFGDANGSGPAGLEQFYLDRTTGLATITIRFSQINSERQVGYAICSAKIARTEAENK